MADGIDELLRGVAPDVEKEVRARLSGLFGGIVRSLLPQAWVFTTDRGTATLQVGADGTARVVPGAAPHPDVTIEVGYQRLHAALTSRDRSKVPPGPLTVAPHTAKGRTAFDYLRGRLGL